MKGENEDKPEELASKGIENFKKEKKKALLSKNYILWLFLSVIISFFVGFFTLTLIRYITSR